jgi:hypothetical protein
VLTDQAVPDLLGQVGKGQWRQRGPGGDVDEPVLAGGYQAAIADRLAPDPIEEEPPLGIPVPLDQGRGDRRLTQGQPRQAPEDVGADLGEHRAAGSEHSTEVPAELPVPVDQEGEERAGVGAPPPHRVELG